MLIILILCRFGLFMCYVCGWMRWFSEGRYCGFGVCSGGGVELCVFGFWVSGMWGVLRGGFGFGVWCLMLGVGRVWGCLWGG